MNSILFGNGLNRLSEGCKSWGDLLQLISEDKYEERIPLTLQYEATEVDILNLIKELKSYPPNVFYETLASLQVEHYLTTNYDYSFKKSFNSITTQHKYHASERYGIRRHTELICNGQTKNIWHIHGEIENPL